jgi:tetratricopeptide (TPR) repeat protein
MAMPQTPSPQDISEKAWLAYRSGDYPAAAGGFADAASAFAAQGDGLNAAEMKNNQSVALLRAKQAQAALEAAQGTEAVFAGAGDFRREGIALANQASALQALKKVQEAIQFYTRAGEALEKGGEDVLRMQVMQLLSSLYLGRFKFYDAIIALQSGLAGVKNPTPRQRLMKKLLFIRL